MQGAAYANGIWIIASAKAGIEDGCELISGSCIISPTGEIVSESTTNNDELVLGEIDTNECLKIRENIFNFKLHRQPVEYEIISKQI
jgi:predicted amidohydrolase